MDARWEQDGNETRLRLRGAPRVLVNALRRCILRDVNTISVTEVKIKTNTSNFWDEYIAHRIALIPYAGMPGELTLNCTGTACHPEAVLSSEIVGDCARVALDAIPIVKLIEGQQLHAEVTVGYGCGRQHARFAPGVCFFNEDGEDTVLHLEPRDGESAARIITEGLAKVGKVIDAMTEYSTISREALDSPSSAHLGPDERTPP